MNANPDPLAYLFYVHIQAESVAPLFWESIHHNLEKARERKFIPVDGLSFTTHVSCQTLDGVGKADLVNNACVSPSIGKLS